MAGTQYWGTAYLGTSRSYSYTGTAGSDSAVGTETSKVRLCCTSDCYFVIGNSVVATSSIGSYLPAFQAEYFTIRPGQNVSSVQVSSAGVMNVTEVW